jgi:hypothetical protein
VITNPDRNRSKLRFALSFQDSEEYRVNYSGGREATVYYTNDLDDAVNTGIAIGRLAR